MSRSAYFSKFTLKDYIASLVKKDSDPPAPSTRDYIKAIRCEERKQPRVSVSSLSPEAKPFLPMQPFYILVSSLSTRTPPVTFSIPMYSSSLPISTLRQYFPLAASMHYFINSELFTLATVKNYDIRGEGVEIGQEEFCIPDFCHHYFVANSEEAVDLGLRKTPAEGQEVLMCVESLQVRLRTTMTELGKLEKVVSELHQLLRTESERKQVLIDEGESNAGIVHDSNQNYLEVDDENARNEISRKSTMDQAEVFGLMNVIKDSELIDGSEDINSADKHLASEKELNLSVSDNLMQDRNYVDDYGFSDSDIDDDGYLANADLKEENVEINDIVDECKKVPSLVKSDSPPSRELESCCLSSRPRCVRRAVRK